MPDLSCEIKDAYDVLIKALEGDPKNDVNTFWNTRRLSGHNLVNFCPDTRKPHDWIAQDVIDYNIDAFCSQCGAKFRYDAFKHATNIANEIEFSTFKSDKDYEDSIGTIKCTG